MTFFRATGIFGFGIFTACFILIAIVLRLDCQPLACQLAYVYTCMIFYIVLDAIYDLLTNKDYRHERHGAYAYRNDKNKYYC